MSGHTVQPAPDGRNNLAEAVDVFAHHSGVHDGINVEIDAPAGVHITVHINEGRVVGMNEATRELLAIARELLKIARELGLTIVGIGNTRHPLLENETFPHHHDQQIFAPGSRDGWPVVWELVKRVGIDKGCGNTGQRQADTSGLTHGVWVALMDGEWGRIA